MKKNLFYAAFALAMMASCTNEDNLVVDPVNPTPETEDQVAINLGVNTPNIVASRGTGTVGGVENEDRTISGWDNQELKIVMVDANGGKAQEQQADKTYKYIFDGLTFNAPYSDATDSNIRIYKSTGLFQHKYYPVTGKFDFYGYHIDGITGYNENITAKTTDAEAIATVTDITIDGSQDILAAQTVKIPTEAPTDNNQPYFNVAQNNSSIDWADMAKNQFSARTARNGFTPILNFEHQLSRLKFYVRAGSDDTASKEWIDNAWTDKAEDSNVTNGNAAYGMTNGAVYVTKISALHMTKTIDIDLAAANGPKTTANTNTTYGAFDLKSSPASDAITKDLVELVPVAPEYPWKSTNKPQDYQGTAIGEAMMFFPDTNVDTEGKAENATDTEIILSIDLAQYLVDTEEENDADNDDISGEKTYILKEQKDQMISLPASKIVGSTQTSGLKFKAGESYNVYITIYGMERIEVSAQLTDWVDGGDVDLDIENDKYPAEDDNTQTPPAVQKTTVTFNITNLPQDETATIELANGTSITYPTVTTVEVDQNSSTTYTITATGFETFNGEIATTETTAASHPEDVTLTATQAPAEKVALTFIINDIPTDPATTATITINGSATEYNHKEGAGTAIEVEKGNVTYTITTSDNKSTTTTIEINEAQTVTVSYNDLQQQG